MGLRFEFDPPFFGFPLITFQTQIDPITGIPTMIPVEVDYSEACEAFCETFLPAAEDYVPVDTGYLQSTIWADWEDRSFKCSGGADAEYAQYVEFGTSRQYAQPYIKPALDEAIPVFKALCTIALAEAENSSAGAVEGGLAGAIGQGIMDGGMAAGASMFGDGMMGILGGAAIGAIGLALFFPIGLVIYGIQSDLGMIPGQPRLKGGGHSASGVTIEIV